MLICLITRETKLLLNENYQGTQSTTTYLLRIPLVPQRSSLNVFVIVIDEDSLVSDLTIGHIATIQMVTTRRRLVDDVSSSTDLDDIDYIAQEGR